MNSGLGVSRGLVLDKGLGVDHAVSIADDGRGGQQRTSEYLLEFGSLLILSKGG